MKNGMMRKIAILLWVVYMAVSPAWPRTTPDLYRAVDPARMEHWVDSVFDTLSEEERIGQLFMIVADPDDLSNVYSWMVGTLEDITYDNLPIIIMVAVVGSIIVQLMAGRLNVMSTGDESARTLGVDVDKERLLLLILVTIVAATVVSFTGVIGFVGLVAPHVARIIVGSDNKYLIPAAGTFGALLMLFADMASRVLADSNLPVGVITACIGGPVFILLILRSSKEAWR